MPDMDDFLLVQAHAILLFLPLHALSKLIYLITKIGLVDAVYMMKMGNFSLLLGG